MKKIISICVLVSAALLSACKDEANTVEYWEEHKNEAKIKLEECNKSGAESLDCKNANKALLGLYMDDSFSTK